MAVVIAKGMANKRNTTDLRCVEDTEVEPMATATTTRTTARSCCFGGLQTACCGGPKQRSSSIRWKPNPKNVLVLEASEPRKNPIFARLTEPHLQDALRQVVAVGTSNCSDLLQQPVVTEASCGSGKLNSLQQQHSFLFQKEKSSDVSLIQETTESTVKSALPLLDYNLEVTQWLWRNLGGPISEATPTSISVQHSFLFQKEKSSDVSLIQETTESTVKSALPLLDYNLEVTQWLWRNLGGPISGKS
ncbi:unnamed protein product, partial [Notodromas monacha]